MNQHKWQGKRPGVAAVWVSDALGYRVGQGAFTRSRRAGDSLSTRKDWALREIDWQAARCRKATFWQSLHIRSSLHWTRAVCLVCVWSICALVVVGVPTSRALQAQDIDSRKEYNVKVACIYGFGRYVQWPAESFQAGDSAFVIGVLGRDPFGRALDVLAEKKTIQNRPIVVRRFSSLKEYTDCHALFIPETTSVKDERAAIERLRGRGVLLIGESPGFVSRGGVIGFYTSQDTVRFQINVAAAKQSQLTIDAKLLSLAGGVSRS